LKLPALGRASVVHPNHSHKLVLTADRISLRFYSLELGTDCFQHQSVIVSGWLLLGSTLFQHALVTFDTPAKLALPSMMKFDTDRDKPGTKRLS
jgi:hypothetical protein